MEPNRVTATATGVTSSSWLTSNPRSRRRPASVDGLTESVLVVKRRVRPASRSRRTASGAPGTTRVPSYRVPSRSSSTVPIPSKPMPGRYPPGMHTIRDLRDDDSGALIELISACWAPYPGMVMDVDAELPHLRAPATAYASLGGRAWAAEGAAGGLAGWAGGVPGSPPASAELRMLYVLASERRAGLGQRLLATAEAAAAGLDATRMELWSDTRFTDAHRFYERNG